MKKLEANTLDQLQDLALTLGLEIDGTEKELRTAIETKLGNFGYVSEVDAFGSSEATRQNYGEHTLSNIMGGNIEVAGMTDFATKYPKGAIPKLLPREIPWGGRRMRMKRVRQTEDDMAGLVLQWNGSRFLFPLECEYADVPWPHYEILKNAKGKRLKQRRRQTESGQIEYVDNWIEVTSYPVQEIGVTPGTENLPRGMKEYIYEMYIEGFPDFTPMMWRQLTMAYDYNDANLAIKPSMPVPEQIKTRRQVLFDRLGMADIGDDDENRIERADIVKQLIAGTPLSEAA